jgi:hypothetical protein
MSAAGVQPQKPLVRDVLLRDGLTLRLQAPTPTDYEDIRAFYDGLSSESRYFRFPAGDEVLEFTKERTPGGKSPKAIADCGRPGVGAAWNGGSGGAAIGRATG